MHLLPHSTAEMHSKYCLPAQSSHTTDERALLGLISVAYWRMCWDDWLPMYAPMADPIPSSIFTSSKWKQE